MQQEINTTQSNVAASSATRFAVIIANPKSHSFARIEDDSTEIVRQMREERSQYLDEAP